MPDTTTLRTRVRNLVESTPFQRSIIGLILINAVILGLETYPGLMVSFGDQLILLNHIIIAVFVAEIVLRIYAHGRSFFPDGWNLFDLFVVIVALIPASGGSEVLRILRLLRVLRLLSTVKSMRIVVSALVAAIPGIVSIGGLLVMVIYVFAVSSATLFADESPEHFGTLGSSVTSLFRVMIADGWGEIVAPLADGARWIWGYFVAFTIASTFVVLNLFVAVTVRAMNDHHDADEAGTSGEQAITKGDLDMIVSELAHVRKELADVRQAQVRSGGS